MTRANDHLSSDDIDAWLAGALPVELKAHLDACAQCAEFARLEAELVTRLAALPAFAPAEGFEVRVMAQVAVPDPFALRSLASARRRIFASRRSLAIAATLVLGLTAAMGGSIAWTLAHRETLVSLGSWVIAEGYQLLWVGVRAVASNVIEQPWYTDARGLLGSPLRLALASAAATLAYIFGLLALRRLLALPTSRVAHAQA